MRRRGIKSLKLEAAQNQEKYQVNSHQFPIAHMTVLGNAEKMPQEAFSHAQKKTRHGGGFPLLRKYVSRA